MGALWSCLLPCIKEESIHEIKRLSGKCPTCKTTLSVLQLDNNFNDAEIFCNT